MKNHRIPGGYVLLARKILDSDVMKGPPLNVKLWIWMLEKANHADWNNLKRGQLHTSIEEMREAMSYKIGYRKRKPSKGQIRNSYEGFTKSTMISTTKSTRGMIITILNYDKYQNPKNYEAHSEEHNEDSTKSTDTTHDIQELKNKESTYTRTNGALWERFNTFWRAYPKKKSKGQAEKAWAKIKPDEPLLATIIEAIDRAKTSEEWNKDNGQFIPYPSKWLNAKGWEDEYKPDKRAWADIPEIK